VRQREAVFSRDQSRPDPKMFQIHYVNMGIVARVRHRVVHYWTTRRNGPYWLWDGRCQNNFVLVKAVTRASIHIPWSGADMSRDGTLSAALRESKVYFFAQDVQMGQTVEDSMFSPPCSFISKTDMNGLHQKQSEAITFLTSKYSFAKTSECYKKRPCELPVPSFKLKFPS
jgi:hypothetical protein